ncbi:MAG: tetratricopeptide repeat protein [Candidatus Saccharicenans sp.]|nr:tetratricopeptide repeat protein [Candidatus Saccharicenans sp.]
MNRRRAKELSLKVETRPPDLPGSRSVLARSGPAGRGITLLLTASLLAVCFLAARPATAPGRILAVGNCSEGLSLKKPLSYSFQKPVDSPLPVRIQEVLARKVGLERLEGLERALKPLVNSPALDLYLLSFWLKGQLVEGLCLSRLQLRQTNSDPSILTNTAAFLYSLGEYQLAAEATRAARLSLPDNPVVWNNLGVLSYVLGQKEEAMKCFKQAVSYDNYQPEANRALYLVNLEAGAQDRLQTHFNNSLQGSYRESLAWNQGEVLLPLSFQQEIYLARPSLPEDFESYHRLIPFYQTAFIRMEDREIELNKTLESLLASGISFPETEAVVQDGLALNSSRAYFYLNESEGRLDFLEGEVERPTDMQLSQLLSQANSQIDSLWRDYQKREKACLSLPREDRLACLQKAREEYCQRYRQQADYFYRKYRTAVLSYFQKAEPVLKNFINAFYFWVRYLPEELRLRKRTEAELRVWRLYQRLWEKTFLMLTRLNPPAFKECLPTLPLEPESPAEPLLTLYDPFSAINLDYQDDYLTFRVRADRVIAYFSDSLRLEKTSGQPLMSTVYLFPPETSGSRPVYLVLEATGRLCDLGELGPWAFAGLSSSTSWKMLINLSLPGPAKN